MVQILPTSSFQFLKQRELVRRQIGAGNDDKGYIVEYSLKYTEQLKESHNDSPLAPEQNHIPDDQLSVTIGHQPLKKLPRKKDDDPLKPRANVEKLMTTF